jgi:uncharacterized tellurite resistance protein B-like protein
LIEYLNVNDPYTVVPEYPRMDGRAMRSGRSAVWIEPGRLVTIDGRELVHGNFYFGTHLGETWAESNDNGVVNPALIIGSGGDHQSYNSHEPPAYRTLPPRLRRDYVTWLAGGSLDRFVPEEFASIYFYGLEHRLMIESRGHDPKIIAEIRRLAALFPSAIRLQRDVARLELFLGKKVSWQARPIFTKEMQAAHRPAPAVLLYLGKRLAEIGVIDAKDAFLWVQSCFKIYFPKPFQRCRPEFEALFEARFTEAYPKGLAVTARRPLKMFYRTATWHRTIDFVLPKEVSNIPDIEQATGLLEQLNYVMSRCAAELDAYDRLLSRKPSAAQTLEAAAVLPKALQKSPWIGRYGDIKRLIDENLAKSGFISTGVASFLTMVGLDASEKAAVPAKTVSSIGQLLDAFDVGFEPDRRYGFVSMATQGGICLFRAQGGGAVELEEVAFQSVRLLSELAVLAAGSDGVVNQREMQVLKSYLEGNRFLSDVQKARLTAIAKSLMRGGTSPVPVLSALSKMPVATRFKACDLVLEIVIADGPANAAEVAFMERLFKAIGRDQNELHAVLHRNADGLVLVQAGKREAGVGIKHEEAEIPAKMAEPDVQEVVIDFERLSRIRAETETVSAILSDIFKEEGISMPENDLGSDVSGSTAASESSPSGDSLFVGLDQEHGDLLSRVLKGRLLREEFDRVCAELGLMSDGALETLNEWGFDNIGEAIMDDGDGVEIFSDFLDDVRSRQVGE